MLKQLFFLLLAVAAILFSSGVIFSAYAANDVASSVAGRILLDVERNGEAWYVHPLTLERYYLGRPQDAFAMMRVMGLGISNTHLAQIPEVGETSQGDLALRSRLAGRILLQVQAHGEAWYVDPVSLTRTYLGRPADAFAVMQRFGLGITHQQLLAIEDGGNPQIIPQQQVPFVMQAPLGEWNDLRQQEGCEESSALMAVAWAKNQSLSTQSARDQIIAMSDWEKETYGSFIDTSAEDTAQRLFREFLSYDDITVVHDISPKEIREELVKGNLVIVNVNGKALENPYFTAGGPLRHMIVVTGFDWSSGEFITHEPGTRFGHDYRYSYQTMRDSLMDYPSGDYVPLPEKRTTAMIVVTR